MNTVADWLADSLHWVVGSSGFWIVWIALLVVLGALPSILPGRLADRGIRGVVATWAGILIAAILWARGDDLLLRISRAGEVAHRDAAAQAGRLEPLLSRLPDGAASRLAQLPWREIGLACALLTLIAVFSVPRRPRTRPGR